MNNIEIKTGDVLVFEDEENNTYIDIIINEGLTKDSSYIFGNFFDIRISNLHTEIIEIRNRMDSRPNFKYYIKEVWRNIDSNLSQKIWSK